MTEITIDEWADQFDIKRQATRRLWMAIRLEFARQEPPMTVRQMFYRMSSLGEVEKTEAGYARVGYALRKMRRAGALAYGWIADNTRWMRKPTTYRGLEAMRQKVVQLYRRDIWESQLTHVEVWLEKDALAGVLYPVTEEFDVPLYVTKGYSSMSYLYAAAEALRYVEKPIYIYHFGDYDASGKDAARSIERSLHHEFGVNFEFKEVAVTEGQIDLFKLQTRPAKKKDPRARQWGDVAVELDALAPSDLRMLARHYIEAHIDGVELAQLKLIEDQERKALNEAWPQFTSSFKLPE